jgi:hypothetical protein
LCPAAATGDPFWIGGLPQQSGMFGFPQGITPG